MCRNGLYVQIEGPWLQAETSLLPNASLITSTPVERSKNASIPVGPFADCGSALWLLAVVPMTSLKQPQSPLLLKSRWPRQNSMDSLPEVNPLEVSGDIITAGSSTVFPLSEAMAERFKDEGYPDNITSRQHRQRRRLRTLLRRRRVRHLKCKPAHQGFRARILRRHQPHSNRVPRRHRRPRRHRQQRQ